MPETWAGDDDWADDVDLLLDGETYTKASFQDGEIKKIINRTTWLRTRLAQIGTSRGDGDVDAAGVGDPVDAYTTATYEDATAIQITVNDLLAGDIVELSGSVMIQGDGAASTALLRMHDGVDGIPGWRYSADSVSEGDGGQAVSIHLFYQVGAPGDITFTLQGRKIAGGDDGFSTHEPWHLFARVTRP